LYKGYKSEKHGILYCSDPFVGGHEIVRFRTIYGGPGPVPGTEEAIKEGCVCPGKTDGDGYIVDELCSLHGSEARSKASRDFLREVMEAML